MWNVTSFYDIRKEEYSGIVIFMFQSPGAAREAAL
jgi:hypothetical protein